MPHQMCLCSRHSTQIPLKVLCSGVFSLSLMPSPGGCIEAGELHDVGLAAVDSVLQPSRHHLEGLQGLQGVHLHRLPQVN